MTVVSTYFNGMRSSVRPVLRLRSTRYWEIDALRGIAIIMMVVYHLMWDLYGLGGYPINVFTGFWHYWQLITASLFIGLVGLALSLSYNNLQKQGLSGSQIWRKQAWRGVVILSWGIGIGVVTYLYDPARYVRFGILHMIGVSIIIAYPFLRLKWMNVILGLLILFLLPLIVKVLGLQITWLEWLGLDVTPHPAFDTFRLIPWFGMVLIGIFLGTILYPGGVRRFRLPDLGNRAFIRSLCLMGQNSLLIYLFHQPVLIAVLMLAGIIRL